jgi:hypothetical protein
MNCLLGLTRLCMRSGSDLRSHVPNFVVPSILAAITALADLIMLEVRTWSLWDRAGNCICANSLKVRLSHVYVRTILFGRV